MKAVIAVVIGNWLEFYDFLVFTFFAVMIFGGTTQLVVAWLINVTGNPLVPAWYQIAATAVSIIGVTVMTPDEEVIRGRIAPAPAMR